MGVPEAAVYEDGLAPPWEGYIGSSGDAAQLDAKTVAKGVEQTSDGALRFSMRSPYARHMLASLRRC